MLEVALYRVIQESVQNTIKHAKANKITVSVDINSDRVTISVKDNGIGFDYEAYLKEPRADSYGLQGMKERVEILGGSLSIRSLQGKGTEIFSELPLEL
jgi:two-component system sensor histidine kinase DegS